MDFVGLWALCRRWKGEEISSSFSNISLDFPCRESWILLAISDNFLGLTLASFFFFSNLPEVFRKSNPKVDFGHIHISLEKITFQGKFQENEQCAFHPVAV